MSVGHRNRVGAIDIERRWGNEGIRRIGILASSRTSWGHWGRARRALIVDWEGKHQAHELWGGKGKSTSMAVTGHTFVQAVARLTGGHSGSVLMDLWK